MLPSVGSSGVCTVDDVVDFLGWGLSVLDQAGSAVEAVLDGLDLGVGNGGEAGVLGHLAALVPGDRGPHGPGQVGDHGLERVGDGIRVVAGAQAVYEHEAAGAPPPG